MTDRHSCGGWERLDNAFSLEDDKHLRIGETHIHKKWEYQVPEHDIRDRGKIGRSKYSKKENIESDDRQWSKYRHDIMRFEEWQEVTKSIEESLEGVVIFGAIRFSIWVDHLDQSSFDEGGDQHIANKKNTQYDQDLKKVLFMDEVY